jgi:transcriptional regulator with XRE-family HTH domain
LGVAKSKGASDNFSMQNRSLDFKTYLQEELLQRCRRNPSYSLRSFAKSVGVSPSFLSKLIRGQRRVTDEAFEKITMKLNLEPTTIEALRQERSQGNPGPTFTPLQLEYFKMISDWYHYAILELLQVKDFSPAPEWIAKKLGITEAQVKTAIERLVNLKLMERRRGKLQATSSGNTTTKNDFTDLAFKKMQDELLHKAIHSLWNEDYSRRDHSSICVAIDPDDIAEVKKRLANMRREICQFLERPQRKKPTQVYNLSLSFFSLTKESL